MHPGRTTLSKFLIQQLQDVEDQGKLAALLVDVAAAVKAISAMTAKGALGGMAADAQSGGYLGAVENTNVPLPCTVCAPGTVSTGASFTAFTTSDATSVAAL